MCRRCPPPLANHPVRDGDSSPKRPPAVKAGLTLLLALCVSASGVSAEPIYDHPRIIAPAAPGGGWDQTARAMQQALQTDGHRPTASVENIPGAAGTIGLARFIGAERGSGDVVMVSG